MKDLVQRGQVTRMHELSADGLEWRKAELFTELYPSAVPAVMVASAAAIRPGQEQSLIPTGDDLAPVATAANLEWYANIDDDQVGPVTERAMQKWVASGKLKPDTLIWKTGMDEWLAAKAIAPHWFSVKKRSPSSGLASAGDHYADTGDDLSTAIVAELRRHKAWVFVLAISGIVLTGLYVIGSLFLLIQLIVAPSSSGDQAVGALLLGLCGMAMSVIGFLAALNLLQFANSLTTLQFAQTTENGLRSLRSLSRFWLYAGICVATFTIVIGLGILLSYTVGLHLLN